MCAYWLKTYLFESTILSTVQKEIHWSIAGIAFFAAFPDVLKTALQASKEEVGIKGLGDEE
jgi:DNA-binding ferritin-like protein